MYYLDGLARPVYRTLNEDRPYRGYFLVGDQDAVKALRLALYIDSQPEDYA